MLEKGKMLRALLPAYAVKSSRTGTCATAAAFCIWPCSDRASMLVRAGRIDQLRRSASSPSSRAAAAKPDFRLATTRSRTWGTVEALVNDAAR